MSIHRFSRRVPSSEAGRRLDLVTHEWLEAVLSRRLSKSTIRRLIMAGAVRVEGRPAPRPGFCVAGRTQLEAVVDVRRLPPVSHEAADEGWVEVLFEDETLLAVAKPSGLQVHVAADPSVPDLFTIVRRHLAERSGAPYLALHHRLDRGTSGVVLFVKAREANAGVAAQFEGHRIEKVYHALTTRPVRVPARPWRVENELAQAGKGRRARIEQVKRGGQRAVTQFAVLECLPSALLVEARPQTGRKHQIRAQLRGSEMPILGDGRYDGPLRLGPRAIGRVMLHAERLVLQHPLTGQRLEIVAGYPDDFQEMLAGLRRGW